jgi:hypothetical protein
MDGANKLYHLQEPKTMVIRNDVALQLSASQSFAGLLSPGRP